MFGTFKKIIFTFLVFSSGAAFYLSGYTEEVVRHLRGLEDFQVSDPLFLVLLLFVSAQLGLVVGIYYLASVYLVMLNPFSDFFALNTLRYYFWGETFVSVTVLVSGFFSFSMAHWVASWATSRIPDLQVIALDPSAFWFFVSLLAFVFSAQLFSVFSLLFRIFVDYISTPVVK